jgi:hypothetical protein
MLNFFRMLHTQSSPLQNKHLHFSMCYVANILSYQKDEMAVSGNFRSTDVSVVDEGDNNNNNTVPLATFPNSSLSLSHSTMS